MEKLTIFTDEPVLPLKGAAGSLMPPPGTLPDHAHTIPQRVQESLRVTTCPVAKPHWLIHVYKMKPLFNTS